HSINGFSPAKLFEESLNLVGFNGYWSSVIQNHLSKSLLYSDCIYYCTNNGMAHNVENNLLLVFSLFLLLVLVLVLQCLLLSLYHNLLLLDALIGTWQILSVLFLLSF